MRHLIPSFVVPLLVSPAALAATPNRNAVAAVPEPVGAVVFAAGAAMVLASLRRNKR